MTTKSHNKKRNVGIIYEQLLATVARGIVENNQVLVKRAQRVLKRFFTEGSEIYKEHRLFKAMVEVEIKDGSLATKILEEAKKASRTHNVARLDREKSRMIKEINHSFSKSFYTQKVENYTDFATIQTLLNDWRLGKKANFDRVTLYENKAHAILTQPKKKSDLKEHQNKEVDNLVVKVMTEKYNDKYGKQLTDVQQMLIKQYVFAESGDSKGFKSMLKRIQETVINDLIEYQIECDNNHVANKINEVKEDIHSLDINTLDDQTMTRFLTLCDLSEELRRK